MAIQEVFIFEKRDASNPQKIIQRLIDHAKKI
jgi:hypothetical protein